MQQPTVRLVRSFANNQLLRMNLEQAEIRLGVSLFERHRQAMLDPNDPIHNVCDFLIPESPYELLRWVEVNEFLHAPDSCNCWPSFLVAFASNGCGDYFAYDTRSESPRIIYVDPDKTVEENLAMIDGFEFPTFEAWYDLKMDKRRPMR